MVRTLGYPFVSLILPFGYTFRRFMENNDESRVIISNTVIIVYLFLELLLDARAVHTIPCATFWSSFSNEIPGLRSSGLDWVLSFSHTPTASTITKWSLCVASGVTPRRSSD